MRTIKNLHVRYIRGARRVDIHHPSDSVVEIAGDNGSGKSSTLDAIEWGIRGKRALPEDPLHHGASSGTVKINLGDLVITRRINEGNAARGGTVTIQAADGSKWGQKDLEQLYGAWTFDPLAFAQMRPEQQVSKIRTLAGREFCAELEILDQKIADTEASRTEAGREVKRFGALPDLPRVEPVDTCGLAERFAKAQDLALQISEGQAAVDEKARRVDDWAASIAGHQSRVDSLRDELAKAERALAEAKKHAASDLVVLNDMKRALEGLEQPEPMGQLQAELASAHETNAAAEAWRRNEVEREKWSAAVRLHEELQATLEDLREQRTQHVRTAKLPVPGLSWDGGKIALDGTPFRGLSTTEQLLLSARIGMAMSPDLNVMLVREGGLIDRTRFAALRELAAAEGCQVWVETAGEGHDSDALVIEAGELDDSDRDSSDDWQE